MKHLLTISALFAANIFTVSAADPAIPTCSGMGEGSCCVQIWGEVGDEEQTLYHGGHTNWMNAALFDHNVVEIGQARGVPPPYSLWSTLPYTVEIPNPPTEGDDNKVAINYAGYAYGYGQDENFNCLKWYDWDGGVYRKQCIHAFPCGAQ